MNVIKNVARVKTYLFYTIVFLIPLNLGKHFILNSSYGNGLLIDYFIPTVYVQDALVFLFVLLTLFSVRRPSLISLFNSKFFLLTVLFLISLVPSVFIAENGTAAIQVLVRTAAYIAFSFCTYLEFSKKLNFGLLVKVLSGSVLLVSLLGVLQWVNQGSVFDNYLFFGEQPYNFSTYNIVRENFFGVTKLPSYGLFRHPNVFAGFLAISLIWMLVLVPENKFVTVSFVLGCAALFFTLSYFAWFVFLLGVALIFLPRRASLTAFLLLFLLSFSLPLLSTDNVSITRRASFLEKSGQLFLASPVFGVGLGNSPLYAPEAKFLQPIHHVFPLILAESGLFSLVLFCALLVLLIAVAWKKKLLLVSLICTLLLFSFDHYFFTIHQTQLFFWLTAGIIYSYNSSICGTKS